MSVPDWMSQGYPHIWLPYTQMQTAAPPLAVVRSEGSRLTLADGRSLIDGVASWWTACHGYNHPHIAQAVAAQLQAMPHVMFGGMVHEPALRLAQRLADCLGPGLDRVFYTDSGSVAVEVAMKMALQFWMNQGRAERRRFLSFRGGYHGDTFGTMAVCDPEEGMHSAFRGMLIEHVQADLPRDEASLKALRACLEREAAGLAGIVLEPLVQGAGGMLMHEPQVLRDLRALADEFDLLLIFDEIFTGFGRTGTMFAFEQAGVRPDIITLSKALTGGTLPLAATVASERIFEGFLSEQAGHALMHGPTFMGNALACAAANASLDLFEREPRLAQVQAIEAGLRQGLAPCATLPWVTDVRVMGAIGAVELPAIVDLVALKRRLVEAGVWVRPFGRIVYLTPAFTITPDELAQLTAAICQVLAQGAP
ncbi:adenosylmethionine--8-amino-7-oxononanoate transaminase [Bordetella trematum]|uniref:Adenosylmethionine-8-amino-7-oxononanoate aminotransferase n=1 Tax=Bordetella trematum TaxID=123899 RepID=A0A157LD52_9BORD|nr:adenosylmethionine--8-amino-7-oxononanoate transaminase [Bordetella trematum]AUL47895.1 adenosylmethionine--8-amino-7-oxononanoate transaminase [Bordetella trematum]AZR94817.1 adenosylmethionine--8-amino-7-oxononanoate transaminase [Bordetella trematum]NNH20147.1 adenosylmethionine--8-amino-7-oxononanoate transaminase [Bordetella trematum]QIM73321.1 adenosylmethionine--8-amino-7-oxononanoate transaminase [Bordetella trematum]SAH94748.1 adenosylmethionine--8-amino-7-oxononanoate transaminase